MSRSCPWVKLMPKFFMGIFFVILLLFIKLYVRIPLIKSFRRLGFISLLLIHHPPPPPSPPLVWATKRTLLTEG